MIRYFISPPAPRQPTPKAAPESVKHCSCGEPAKPGCAGQCQACWRDRQTLALY